MLPSISFKISKTKTFANIGIQLAPINSIDGELLFTLGVFYHRVQLSIFFYSLYTKYTLPAFDLRLFDAQRLGNWFSWVKPHNK